MSKPPSYRNRQLPRPAQLRAHDHLINSRKRQGPLNQPAGGQKVRWPQPTNLTPPRDEFHLKHPVSSEAIRLLTHTGVVQHALLLPLLATRPKLRLINTPAADRVINIDEPPPRVKTPKPGFTSDAYCLYWCGEPILQLAPGKRGPHIEFSHDPTDHAEHLNIRYDDLNHLAVIVTFPHSAVMSHATINGKPQRIKPHQVGRSGLVEAISFFLDSLAAHQQERRREEKLKPPVELVAHLKALIEFSHRSIVLSREKNFGLATIDDEGIGDLAVISARAGYYYIQNCHPERIIFLHSRETGTTRIIFPGDGDILETGQVVSIGVSARSRKPALRSFRFTEPKPVFTTLEIFHLENWELSSQDWEALRVTDDQLVLKRKAHQLFGHARRAADRYSYNAQAVIPIIPLIVPKEQFDGEDGFKRWVFEHLNPLLTDQWLRHAEHVLPYRVVFIPEDQEVRFYDLLMTQLLEISFGQLSQ